MPGKNCSGRWQPKASRGYRLKHQREIWAICMMFSDKSRISCALPQDLTRLQGVARRRCKKCCKMQSGSRNVGGMPTIENGEWRSLLQYRRSLERPVVNFIDTCMNVAGMCRWSSFLGNCVAGSGGRAGGSVDRQRTNCQALSRALSRRAFAALSVRACRVVPGLRGFYLDRKGGSPAGSFHVFWCSHA